MVFFGHKKTRSSRAAEIRDTSSVSVKLHEALQDRGVLLRLLLCLIAMIALLFAIEGWKSSFPYRLGDRLDHGVAAKIDFALHNDRRTTLKQQESEDNVHLIFRRDPTALNDLPAKLRGHLRDVAEAVAVDDLPQQTQLAFGLNVAGQSKGGAGPESQNRVQDFATLKASVSVGEGAARSIDDLIGDFQRFLSALKEQGVVDRDELKEHNISVDRMIAVVSETDKADRQTYPAGQLLIGELISETGGLGQVWTSYSKLEPIRPMLELWLLKQSPVTLHYDAQQTQSARVVAREAVQDQYDPYNRGEVLVAPGDVIDDGTLGVLRAQYRALEKNVRMDQRLERVAIIFILVLVLGMLIGYYVVHNEPQLVASAGRLGMFLAISVLAVWLGRLLSYDPWRAEIIPLAVTVMVFAIAYNQILAALTAFALALIITLSTTADLGHFVVLMSVSTTAVISLAQVPSRSTVIKVGFLSGLVFFAVTWGTEIIVSQTLSDVWSDTNTLKASLCGGGWCVAAGYLVAGSLPFIEAIFGVVTDISLLELGDVSHPLLQELVRRAPGTYNHSISVATIGETAANRIGANGLLVRVGAYFHDIGKMLKPQYFIENTTEGFESRHEHLAPAMSTLIIIGHVKDGTDLARQHNLPRSLIDFIEQHHGTTLVEYFYNEATKQVSRQPDHKTDAEESSFRYPGPKPQTREAGVMMLADAVESASRTLSDPAPKRIESLVHEIVMKRLLDRQLDESSLTLTEIKTVEDSLTKSLIAIYHGRVKYPEQRTA